MVSKTPFSSSDIDMTDQAHNNAGISFIKEFAGNMSLEMLNTPDVKEALLKGNFDASTKAHLSRIPAVLQVPWIQLAATQVHPDIEAQVDEVRSVPTIPLMFNPSGVPMSSGRAATIKQYEDFFTPIAAARGVTLPPFDDAFYNVSITFVNSHESLTPAFTTPPNVDLQELLDGSPQGVIYFSMGSVLRSSALKPHTRAGLLKMFAALPHTVLWKFEEPLKDLPPNVHVRPWMPQPRPVNNGSIELRILSAAHPNVKVFITHGGAHHLRSTSLKYKWYERWMLDVLLAVLVTLASIVALLVYAVKKVISKVTGKKVYTEKSNKKKRN
ncbi:hypothetical protein HF086_009757 [Spodoptera exigua]|uniref:Uncharacterized protein n=1 Tax=Spodoptera exigua TaxID=7107 RepID=A0A922MB32_SPOEX|nr:hypothetical protein HF086_009757 [Spodoptera exigua]